MDIGVPGLDNVNPTLHYLEGFITPMSWSFLISRMVGKLSLLLSYIADSLFGVSLRDRLSSVELHKSMGTENAAKVARHCRLRWF